MNGGKLHRAYAAYPLVTMLVVAALAWPAVQMTVSAVTGMSSWRLFGWGMYATPNRPAYSEVTVARCRPLDGAGCRAAAEQWAAAEPNVRGEFVRVADLTADGPADRMLGAPARAQVDRLAVRYVEFPGERTACALFRAVWGRDARGAVVWRMQRLSVARQHVWVDVETVTCG